MPTATLAASTSLGARGPQALLRRIQPGALTPPAGRASSGGTPEPGRGGSRFQPPLSTSCRFLQGARVGRSEAEKSGPGSTAIPGLGQVIGSKPQMEADPCPLEGAHPRGCRGQHSPWEVLGTLSSPCRAAAQKGPTPCWALCSAGHTGDRDQGQRARRGDGIIPAQPSPSRGTNLLGKVTLQRPRVCRTQPGDKEEVQPEPTHTGVWGRPSLPGIEGISGKHSCTARHVGSLSPTRGSGEPQKALEQGEGTS